MYKRFYWAVLLVLIGGTPCHAAIETIPLTVLADASLGVPLAILAREYSRHNDIAVNVSFAPADKQAAAIEQGEAADIYITADATIIDQLKQHGLVDVYSQTLLAKDPITPDIRYQAVVIAGEQMESARKFLTFLKTPEGQQTLERHGLAKGE